MASIMNEYNYQVVIQLKPLPGRKYETENIFTIGSIDHMRIKDGFVQIREPDGSFQAYNADRVNEISITPILENEMS